MLKVLSKIWKSLSGLLAIFVFLALWEIAPRLGLANPAFLPPFSKVAVDFWSLLTTGELLGHVLISLHRAFFGFGLGVVIGIPLGLLLGGFKAFERFLDPLLQTFRQTSALALFPVFILFFGIGETSKVAIIVWGVLWPILLNTIAASERRSPDDQVSPGDGRILGYPVSESGAARGIPSIFTGIRLSATYAILMLIAAEMIGSNSGLGFLLYESELNFQVPTMYVTIITMALLGLAVNYLLVSLEGRVTRWKEDVAFK